MIYLSKIVIFRSYVISYVNFQRVETMVCTWDVTKRNVNVSQQQLVDIKRHPWPKIRVSHLRRKVIIIIIIITSS